MLSIIKSAALLGIDSYPVEVEVDLSNGLPAFDIVGLPDSAVKESRERVRTAIRNAGFSFPVKRITVNLAPADTKKEGAAFDLPIALGILSACNLFSAENRGCPHYRGAFSGWVCAPCQRRSAHAV